MILRRLGAALGAALILAVTGGAPLRAQVDEGGALSLAGQSTFVRPGGLFDLDLRVAGVGVRHTIEVEIHEAVTSRSAFLAGLRPGSDLGEPIHRVDSGPIGELRTANTDLLSVRVRTSTPDDERPDTVVVREGVHPVRVILARPDGTPVDEIVTHLLVLPADPERFEPLAVSMLVHMDPPVALQPDQQLSVDADTRATLDTWVEALRIHDDVPVDFRVPGETIEALFRSGTDDDKITLEALRSVADGRTFWSSTYVTVDHEAWRGTSAENAIGPLRSADQAALAEHLPDALLDPTTHIVNDTDTGETLLWLQQNGIDRVVVDPDRLQPLDPERFPLTVTAPFVLEHADGGVDAIAVDAVLGSHIGATGSPVLDASRTLADLTLLALDEPGIGRGVVIPSPPGRQPDQTLLTTLLTGIERSPLLDATSVERQFDTIDKANAGGNGSDAELSGFPLVRRLQPATEAPSLGAYPAQLGAAQDDLASFETVVGANSPLTAPLGDLLLVSGAAQHGVDERAAYIDTVRTQLARSNDAVATETEQSVSLTARQADVPISVTNDLGVAARIHLVLESDKLEFPEGDRLELVLEPGDSTVEIPVRARTSGGAVLEITPRSPDDRLTLGDPTQVTVRSTVLSGLGIIISVIALAVL
ncbi:MAG: DUF6049 family protein, partial [Acidimicrobiia bacterium]|nr:DUF6049 family protein [Acidimicrobiia bacterium]